MKKYWRKYRLKRSLKKVIKNFDDQKITITPDKWLHRIKKSLDYFDNDPELRSLVATILVKWRNKFPYRPQFAEAKKLYDEYFQMENHIPSFDDLKIGDHIVQFRTDAPVKGKRFAEYWVNGSGFRNKTTHKLTEKNEKYDYFRFELDSGRGISRDFFTSYRYATKTEIEKYKSDMKRYKSIEKDITKTQKSLEKLYNSKSKIFS